MVGEVNNPTDYRENLTVSYVICSVIFKEKSRAERQRGKKEYLLTYKLLWVKIDVVETSVY